MRTLLSTVLIIACVWACAWPAAAQNREFLTPDEIDQLRIAQEPNLRLQLYTTYALLRIDQIEQMTASSKAGRAAFIHDLIEDYSRIVEAMDAVADDALAHKIALDKGISAVVESEKDFLARLGKVRDAKPKDLPRYEFVLRDAIDTTEDSLEANQQDLGARSAEVLAKEQKAKDERKANMTPQEAAERKEEDKKTGTTPKRKPPTLRRPGEASLPGSTPPAK
jgi:hypothetical protein